MKIRMLFLLMVVLALIALGAVCEPPPSGPMRCIDFEDLALGTIYTVGISFHPSGYTVTGKDFQWSNGIWTNNGYAKVDNVVKAGGSGKDMQVNNINLDFNFGGAIKELRFRFGEYGGNLNIDINGDFKNFNNFVDIKGTTIGGVNVSVTNGLGNDKGEVKLTGGTINSFAVGGQELWLDDICPSR